MNISTHTVMSRQSIINNSVEERAEKNLNHTSAYIIDNVDFAEIEQKKTQIHETQLKRKEQDSSLSPDWTPEDIIKLFKYVWKFGLNWGEVSKHYGRNAEICRNKYFQIINTKPCKEWDESDDDRLIKGVTKLGMNNWEILSLAFLEGKHFPTQCKTRFSKITKKQKTQKKIKKERCINNLAKNIDVNLNLGGIKNLEDKKVIANIISPSTDTTAACVKRGLEIQKFEEEDQNRNGCEKYPNKKGTKPYLKILEEMNGTYTAEEIKKRLLQTLKPDLRNEQNQVDKFEIKGDENVSTTESEKKQYEQVNINENQSEKDLNDFFNKIFA